MSDGFGYFVQQIHPDTVFMMAWAIIRATAANKPRASAGVLGYVHTTRFVVCTSETCNIEIEGTNITLDKKATVLMAQWKFLNQRASLCCHIKEKYMASHCGNRRNKEI